MNTKTLMLAAFAALSLNAATAMAQEGGPSMATVDYWAAKGLEAHHAQVTNPRAVQSGSSDVDAMGYDAALHFNYGTLATPG